MKHRVTKFRRMGITAIAAATALTGLSMLGLSTAAFAKLATGSSITAVTAPGISNTGTNQPAGNLNINFAPGTSWVKPAAACVNSATCTTANSDMVTLQVADSSGTASARIKFDHAPTVGTTTGSGDASLCSTVTGCIVWLGTPTAPTTSPSNQITIVLTGSGQNTTATPANPTTPTLESLNLTNIGYTTAAALNGPVTFSLASTAGATGGQHLNQPTGTFTVNFASSNAIIGKPVVGLVADTTPTITTGGTTAGGPWELTFRGAGTALAVGDQIYVTVARNDGTNCETLGFPDSIGFSAAPVVVVAVAQNGTTTAAPTFSASLATAGGSSCAGFSGINNELVLTVTSGATLGTGAYTNGAAIDVFLASPTAGSGPSFTVSADTYSKANYTTPPFNATGTNLGDIDVAVGLNAPPKFGNSTRIGGTTASPPGVGTVTPTNTPKGVNNDELLGGSILPGAGNAPGPVVTTGAATAAGCPAGTFGSIPVNTPAGTGLPWAIPTGTTVLIGSPANAPNSTSELVTLKANAAKGATALSVVCFTPVGAVNVAGQPVSGPSNANAQVAVVTVTANTPSTTLQYNFANCRTTSCGESVNNPISPIVINENTPGALGGGVNGYFCITLTQVAAGIVEWNSSSTPTATATGGGIVVNPTVTLFTPGGQSGPTVLEGQVTTASSGTAGTVTISGLSVNVPEAPIKLTASLVYQSNSPACTAGANLKSSSNPFTLANVAGRTFGYADYDTAAQEFENLGCSTGHDAATTTVPGYPTGTTPEVAVVAASDIDFNDAEAGSFLAGSLPGPGVVTPAPGARSNPSNAKAAGNANGTATGGTGILVTPQGSLAPSFLNALQVDGVTDVYVLGGVDAFSQANITQLESTPVYNCDGSVHLNPTNGTTQYLTVHIIAGPDADGTAELAGDLFGPGGVGTADFPGAYTTGTSQYNDTTGSNGSSPSTAPDTPVSTCIVANDSEFQDAASGGAMAANGGVINGNGKPFPLFETTQSGLSIEAETGLINDACSQVIDLGGPAALSDTVLSQEEALGMQVLRIGGQDYTDTSQLTSLFELSSINLSQQAVGLDWDPSAVTGPYIIVARGDYYTDAFTAAGLSKYSVFQPAGHLPILLTYNTTSTYNTTNYLGNYLQTIGQTGYDLLSDGTAKINNIWFIGGTFAITQSLENTVVADLNTKGTPS